jgi:4-amino-4-deoxy-L-arabinose transferase-like glycosyltransferase
LELVSHARDRGARLRQVILLLAVVIANGLWWSSRIPFDGAPDEADHFAVDEFVARTGRLPRYGEERFAVSLMDSTTHERFLGPDEARRAVALCHRLEQRQPYLFTPQLPYFLVGRLGGATPPRARFFSTLWLACAALLVYAAGRLLWPERPWLALTAALLLALWPQVTFVGAYCNDDAFALVGPAFLLVGVLAVERQVRVAHVWLALGAALTASSKYYDLALLPLVAAWALSLGRRRGARAFAVAAGALVVGAALGLPWLVRNAHLYGDPLGLRWVTARLDEAARALPPEVRAQTNLLQRSAVERGVTWASLWQRRWLGMTARSFFGYFGWMRVPLPDELYLPALLVVVAALLAPWLHRRRREATLALFGLPFLALLAALSLYNTLHADFQAQGRYLLPAVAPLVLQLVDGVAELRLAPALLLSFFVAMNLAVRALFLL